MPPILAPAPLDTTAVQTAEPPLYTRSFFGVFVAVVLFMTGVALQFHFGEYIGFLGYGVDGLGRIMAVSLIGTLLFRQQIGIGIERWGCRRIWIAGATVVTLGLLVMPLVHHTLLIIALRCAIAMASATVMTTVAVFAALVAPPHRRAESLGTMGMSGFIGMLIGSSAGDVIFGMTQVVTLDTFWLFFSSAALCSLASCAIIARVRLPLPSAAAAPHSHFAVIRRHWPGPILFVGVAFGMAFSMQSLYLERFAESAGFEKIKVFFVVYTPTALILRIVARRLPQTLGRRRTLGIGLLCHAGGVFSLAFVDGAGLAIPPTWQLAIPGFLMGAGHCFVFPSMVDLGAAWLPAQHRGTGTSLILGAVDTGMILGYFGLGESIARLGYRTTFVLLALAILASVLAVAADSLRASSTRYCRPGDAAAP